MFSLRSILARFPLYRRFRVNRLLGYFLRYTAICDTPDEAYGALDSVLSRLIDYDRIAIRLADTEARTVTDAFISGERVEAWDRDAERPLQGSSTEAILYSTEPIIIADTNDRAERYKHPFLKTRNSDEATLPSMMVVPIFHAGEAIGSIMIRSKRKGAFSRSDAELLQHAAIYITPTLVSTLYVQQLERELREDQDLDELDSAVGATVDFNDVWELLVHKVQSLMPCDRLVIAMMDDEGTSVLDQFVYGVRVPNWDEFRTHTIAGASSERVIALQKARIMGQKETDDLHEEVVGYRLSDRTGLRSAIIAPLVARDRVIGTLSVRSTVKDAYTEQNLALFKRIAHQISGPLAAAQMHSRLLQMATAESAKKDLEARNKQLLDMHIAKSRFISTISHELRTPLTSILAFSEIIKRSKQSEISERDIKHLDVITRSGERLKVLIDDLLDMSEIEADMIRINGSDCTLSEVMDGVSHSIEPILRSKSQSLQVVLEHEEMQLVTDRERVEQIMVNLLSNANKYSPEGSRITVLGETEGERVRLAVIDQGPGILDQEQSVIFEAFNRLDNEVTRSNQGSGLGLAIARNLARALGGDIQVASEPGKGSTFTLILPKTLSKAA